MEHGMFDKYDNDRLYRHPNRLFDTSGTSEFPRVIEELGSPKTVPEVAAVKAMSSRDLRREEIRDRPPQCRCYGERVPELLPKVFL